MVTSDFVFGAVPTEFWSPFLTSWGGVGKWYIGSELGETTIKVVFSDPEIGGNVFFEFNFTPGHPPPPPTQ